MDSEMSMLGDFETFLSKLGTIPEKKSSSIFTGYENFSNPTTTNSRISTQNEYPNIWIHWIPMKRLRAGR